MSLRGILDKVREEEADTMTGLTSRGVSMFGLTVTSSSWDFYQSTIAPYLSTSYHISASFIGKLLSTPCWLEQTTSFSGLILLSPGLTYIPASILCGFILDRTSPLIWCQVLGTLAICLGYIKFGPRPVIAQIKALHTTAIGLAIQGVGFGFAYIGNILI